MYKLLVILFLVGFISDLVTQQVAKRSSTVALLGPYWEKYTPIGAALIAGIITLGIGGFIIYVTMKFFDLLKLPINMTSGPEATLFILAASSFGFIIGMIADLATNRSPSFLPSLDLWYDNVGESFATLWTGGLAFSFTVFVALVANLVLS